MSRERWRLILGDYAGARLGEPGGIDAERDAALGFLYHREYQRDGGRGIRPDHLSTTQLSAVEWLGQLQTLFPRETVERIEAQALSRYGLTELLTDPTVLQRLQPNLALVRVLLTLRTRLQGEVLSIARRLIAEVVGAIRRQLEPEWRRELGGQRHRGRHSPIATAQSFDPHGTIRHNLKHYDRERRQLRIERARFFDRNVRRLPWQLILCIDQSGSMVDSVIYSAIVAGICCGLPLLRVRLVLFDTRVVDLSNWVDDPVEVLLRAQLGGGTDIAGALRYCAGLIEQPQRTALVLVSDFCEGGSPAALRRVVTELAAARVRLRGLAALTPAAAAVYDRQIAGDLAAHGMPVAALSPTQLAAWLAEVLR